MTDPAILALNDAFGTDAPCPINAERCLEPPPPVLKQLVWFVFGVSK
jgi:hypothetical protein